MRIGVAGWKYFGAHEASQPETWLETPSFIVDALRRVVGSEGAVVNANALLMNSSTGLRSIVEVDQIAQFEYSAVYASEAIKRAMFGLKPEMSEFETVALMELNGLPLSCHTMVASGFRTSVGLVGPSSKRIKIGEPMMMAVGLWGALTCRAGWVARYAGDLPAAAVDYVAKVAEPYFACAAEWYRTIGIGVSGGSIDALVRGRLGDSFFNLILNPGHLIHVDEWMNTPVYPGSAERFRSGNVVQCDIIPAIRPPYFTINIEDGVALLEENGRSELKEKHPGVWERIIARRAFMADTLGIELKPETLPLSNIPGYVSPYLLSPGQALAMR
jgi:Xaa-Pro aminopeptidase